MIDNYYQNVSIEMMFMNTENNKTNEPHNVFFNFHKLCALIVMSIFTLTELIID